MCRALPYFEETGKFSLALPNAANFVFHFPTVLKGFLLCGFMPGRRRLRSRGRPRYDGRVWINGAVWYGFVYLKQYWLAMSSFSTLLF